MTGDFGDFDETEQDDLVELEIEQICREALLCLELGATEQARGRVMDAIDLDDEHPFPFFVLGLIADYEGDEAAARYLSDKTLRFAENNADAIQFRAQLHARSGELEKAEQLLRGGLVHNPDDATMHDHLARVQLAAGNHEGAIASARAALRIEPTNEGARAVQNALLDDTTAREEQLAGLRRAAQLYPDDPYTLVELALCEVESGNIDRGRVLLARAQRLEPLDLSIADARAIIDGAHAGPLLGFAPRALGWAREFPGGTAGLVFGLLVALLPVHAAAQANPRMAALAYLLLGVWAAAAVYLWIAPSALSRALNRYAGKVSLAREPKTPSQVVDAVRLMLTGRSPHHAAEYLTAHAALFGPIFQNTALGLAGELGSRRMRAWRLATALPGGGRLAGAVAALLVFADAATTLPAPRLAIWGIAATLLAGWAFVRWRDRVRIERVTQTLISAYEGDREQEIVAKWAEQRSDAA